MSPEVQVLLHGTPLGALREDDEGTWVFRFGDAYRRRADRPVLGQKFEDDLSRAYKGKKGNLPPFFANLVPEADGELRPILERHLGIEKGDDLTLLERLGRDLPGAVEIRQHAAPSPRPTFDIDPAIEPTEPRETDGEWMRFSLAGVQLKFSVLLADDRITLPAHGRLGDWLVKLDSRRFPGLCANEHAVMTWARVAGFEVPEIELRPSSALVGGLAEHTEPDTHVLAIRRYDRDGSVKIHQEDFAQVVNLPPKHKYDHVSYEDLARLVAAIVGDDAIDEYIRRLTFMIASGNGDAHLKNWSLLYRDRVRATLAPLYDQVATIAWPDKVDRRLALNLGGTKEMSQVSRGTLENFARKSDLGRERTMAKVDETLAELARAFREASSSPGWSMPHAHVDALHEHWRRTPLLRESPLGRL